MSAKQGRQCVLSKLRSHASIGAAHDANVFFDQSIKVIVMATGFSFTGVIVRFIIALLLVFLTYNPSGYSYFHWIKEQAFVLPVLVLIGVVMAIVWVIFLRATLRSLGAFGIILALALFGCLVWVAVYYQAITLTSQPFVYIVLVVIAAILAVGMSWSHIRRRISGQTDVDDVDE